MLDLKLGAKLSNHRIIEVSPIGGDNPFGDTITADEVVFDESGSHILGGRGKRSGFDPFGKIVDCNKNEAISAGSGGPDLSNHVNAPHCEWP